MKTRILRLIEEKEAKEVVAEYMIDLPLSVLRQILVTLNVDEIKYYLIYAYSENRRRYRASATRLKEMLPFAR